MTTKGRAMDWCYSCQREAAAPGSVRCEKCRQKQREAQRRWRQKQIAEGKPRYSRGPESLLRWNGQKLKNRAIMFADREEISLNELINRAVEFYLITGNSE